MADTSVSAVIQELHGSAQFEMTHRGNAFGVVKSLCDHGRMDVQSLIGGSF